MNIKSKSFLLMMKLLQVSAAPGKLKVFSWNETYILNVWWLKFGSNMSEFKEWPSWQFEWNNLPIASSGIM